MEKERWLKLAGDAAMDAQGSGFLINVSSGICHASSGDDFAEAAGRAAAQYHDQIVQDWNLAMDRRMC